MLQVWLIYNIDQEEEYKNLAYLALSWLATLWEWFFRIFVPCQVTEPGILDEADPDFTETPPGSGPRHLLIDENKDLLYSLYQLKSLLEIFQ